MTRLISAILLCAALMGFSLYCVAGEGAAEAAALIGRAKLYIEEGERERAVSALDEAFQLAESAGDHGALMKIGDLYISINPSFKDKAMKAWTAAGRLKCR